MFQGKQEMEQGAITYSNEVSSTKTGFLFTTLFGLSAVGLIILSIYLGSIDGAWWVLAFFLPIVAILAWFAYIGLPIQRKVIYRYELKDDGIYQQWENTKTGERKTSVISFNQAHKVLIGMKPVPIRIPRMGGSWKHRTYYRFEAILFILYEEGMFMESFWKAEDLKKWIHHFKNKVPIVYTNQDLMPALQLAKHTKIDFSQVQGSSTDTISAYIGQENSSNPFRPWMPTGALEEGNRKKTEISRVNTKKAEKMALWLLFCYAIVSAIILLPQAPLDEDGLIELTDTILIWYLGLNLFIPTILVFFRRYSKWYNPVLYTIVVIVGNTTGLLVASFFNEFTPIYSSVLILNLFNIILWTIVMISGKLIRLLLK